MTSPRPPGGARAMPPWVWSALRAAAVIWLVRAALVATALAVGYGPGSRGIVFWVAVLPSVFELELANDWSRDGSPYRGAILAALLAGASSLLLGLAWAWVRRPAAHRGDPSGVDR